LGFVIRMMPGLIAGSIAFLGVRFLVWLDVGSGVGHFLLFVGLYFIVFALIDKALIAYGGDRE
jgi:hypothetical protein